MSAWLTQLHLWWPTPNRVWRACGWSCGSSGLGLASMGRSDRDGVTVAHDHDHRSASLPATPGIEARLRIVGLIIVAVTVLAVALLWPRGDAPDLGGEPLRYVSARVTHIERDICPGVEVDAPTQCQRFFVRLGSGADRGSDATFLVLDTQYDIPRLSVGDEVVLLDSPAAPAEYRYAYVDRERATPMVWLAVAFAVVVVVFARRQGLRALVGLLGSVLLLVVFLVPALLRDEPAILVALAAASAVACLALYLAHGFTTATTVALVGTLASLLGITLLARLAVTAAHLTGLADPDTQVLRVTAESLNLQGLLIAGIVIGALGSLDDVTVTQVSTVAALRRANPGLSARRLYGEALRVGRDHVASSVNTLVLAYAGAALPLLLFFAQGTQPVLRILTGEIVAIEIVRMLVGSIGLIAAVPVTTALAAYALGRDDVAVPGTKPSTGDDKRSRAKPRKPRWEDFGPVEDR